MAVRIINWSICPFETLVFRYNAINLSQYLITSIIKEGIKKSWL